MIVWPGFQRSIIALFSVAFEKDTARLPQLSASRIRVRSPSALAKQRPKSVIRSALIASHTKTNTVRLERDLQNPYPSRRRYRIPA